MTTPPPFVKGTYAEGGYVGPTTPPIAGGVIPTPVTAWEPLPVVLTEPRLGANRVLGRFLVNIALTFLYAWPLMLIIGALHHHDLPALPALGYWQTLLLMVGLRIVQTVTPVWTLTEERSRAHRDMVAKLGGRTR